ncbi:MAG: TonB-dependent receptor [Rhodoferax sp.]|nr:TonB-dependent receptor [Rhodoferax sp.]MDP3654540.1 TonB-dependent receptor [Rhodoferax sp.]
MRPLPLNKRFTPAPLALAAALTVALAAGYAPMAYAQTGSAATAAPIAINIPAQPLGQALNELARQANLQMTFPAALVAGKAAVSVNGSLTVPQALARLLQGSGLEAHVDGHSVVVKPQPSTPAAEAAMLPVVTVTASADSAAHALSGSYPGGHQARGGRIGMLGNVDTMNAPFAITAFTSQTVENTQAATIADVARLDPMVRSSGMAGDNSDAFFVRGFGVGDNNIGEVAFDGLFGAGPNYRLSADYAERIEIFKGPSAMVYGMSPNGAGGGAINVVPKRAHDDLTRLRADYVAQSQLGGHVDIARRFGSTREFGVRFNGSNRNGSTAIDHQARNASVGALALDYQGEKLSATLDLIRKRPVCAILRG